VALPLSKHSQPRGHGSGSASGDVNPSPRLSTAIAHRGSCYPNPIGSDTSRREHASTQAWRYLRRFRPLKQGRDALAWQSSAFAKPPPCRAASRIPSRKETQSAAPEVPFVDRSPRRVSLVGPPAVSSLATS
jgi:hypothetical protein